MMNRKLVKYYLFSTLFLILFSDQNAFAQLEAKNWYFGYYEGMKFENNQVVELTDSKMNISLGSAVISDKKGNLLFYTDGRTIWNRNHDTMKNGFGLNSYWAIQQAIIIPLPENPNIYYVFSICPKTHELYANEGLWYHIVDISKNNGLGEIISKNNLICKNLTSRLTATYHANKRSIWIIAHEWNSRNFHAFLLNNSGIINSPVTSNIGSYIGGSIFNNNGQMKVTPDGKKIAGVIYQDKKLDIFDFDNKSGKLSNNLTFYFDTIYKFYPFGIEFSPNSKLLYLTTSGNGNGNLWQFNMIIKNSIVEIWTAPNNNIINTTLAVQLGLDKRIYVNNGSSSMGIIYNPDNVGIDCNYQHNKLNCKTGVGTGLPTFLQSYFYLPDIEIKNTCYSDTTSFWLKDTTNIDSVFWSFGDGNYSWAFYPKHFYADTGFYQTKAVIFYDNTRDTFEREIRISNYAYADFGIQDNSQCLRGNSFQFYDSSTAVDGSMTYQWDFGDSTASFQQNPLKSYLLADTFKVKLTVTSSYGCETSKTKELYVHPMPEAAFSIDDTVQCIYKNAFVFKDTAAIKSGYYTSDWFMADSQIINTSQKQINYTYRGNFNSNDTINFSLPVQLIAVSEKGCRATSVKNIVLYNSPFIDFSINDETQCFNTQKFVFNNQSKMYPGTLNDSIANFKWLIDNDTFINISNLIPDTFSPGNYLVSLITTTKYGCNDTLSKYFTVFPNPDAAYLINDESQCFNQQNYILSNNSAIAGDSINKLIWILDNDTFTNSNSVFLNHLPVGLHLFKFITVSTHHCTDTAYGQIRVFASPEMNYFIYDSTHCLRENNFIFKNLSTAADRQSISSKWDLGIFKNNKDSFTYKFSNSGLKNGILVSTTDSGCSDTALISFYVNVNPKAGFSLFDNPRCMDNNRFLIKDTSLIAIGHIKQSAFSFFDDKGNEIFPDKIGDSLHFDYSGKLFIHLKTVSDSGCTDSVVKESHISPKPNISIDLVGNEIQCFNEHIFPLSLNDNASSVKSSELKFIWDLGDGSSDSSLKITKKYADFGTYQILVKVLSDSNCHHGDTLTVVVNPSPRVYFNDFHPQCPDSTYIFTSSSGIDSGFIATETWYKGGNLIFNGHICLTSFEAGADTISLMVVSDKGCSDTFNRMFYYEKPIRIKPIRATVENDSFVLYEWVNVQQSKAKEYFIRRGKNSNDSIYYHQAEVDSNKALDKYVRPDDYFYSYYVQFTDSCDKMSEISEIAKTILVKADTNYAFPVLTWTPYEKWDNGILQYEIQVAGVSKWTKPSEKKFQKLDYSPEPVEYTDSFTRLNEQNYCYRVIAYKNGNDSIISVSNEVCIPTKCLLFMPNAFSPNNDGINDEFLPQGVFVFDFHIVIYNRWGEKVFESNDMKKGWNGTYLNEPCPAGVYFYEFSTKGTQLSGKKKSGTITLIR